MARDLLLNENVAAGQAFLRELDARNEAAEMAAWVYFNHREEWRLVLDFEGRRGIGRLREPSIEYLMMLSGIIHQNPDIETGLSLDQVHLGRDAAWIADAITAILGAGRWDRPRRIGPTMGDGGYIEDALVYRAGYRAAAPVGE